MKELSIDLEWRRADSDPVSDTFSNAHTIHYNDKDCLKVDAAPDWGGNPDYTNPEQALAASISSCHMMTFMALASKSKWPVTSFRDQAIAHLGRNPKGQMSVTRIDLHPEVQFDDGFTVEAAELEKMHHRAHRYCFIANTLSDSVKINIL